MDSCLQDYSRILQYEESTLRWIRNKTAKIPSLSHLNETATDAVYKFDKSFGMNVYLAWSVVHEGCEGRILDLHVGGLIQLEGDAIVNTSYYLCIIDDTNKKVLRKYHFDYANSTIRQQRRSSVFHMQYAGKLAPELPEDCDAEHLDSWLEAPRIFFTPMTLSLVLHMVFREFRDEYTDRLCEDGEWQSVFVHRDQNSLILPFFRSCMNVMEDRGEKAITLGRGLQQ